MFSFLFLFFPSFKLYFTPFIFWFYFCLDFFYGFLMLIPSGLMIAIYHALAVDSALSWAFLLLACLLF